MEIAVITHPDKVYDDSLKILLIYPSPQVKNLLNEYLKTLETSVSIYLYEESNDSHNPEWLMSTIDQSDLVYYDMDNTPPTVKILDSFILSKNKTYWLTQGENLFYTFLSRKRLYNYDQLTDKIGGLIG